MEFCQVRRVYRRFGPYGTLTTVRETCARTKAVLKPPHSMRPRVGQAANQAGPQSGKRTPEQANDSFLRLAGLRLCLVRVAFSVQRQGNVAGVPM